MSDRIPPLAALRAFAAVARAGSFSRAAMALNISTSAVSHQVRGLEEALGATLLTRARNGSPDSATRVTEAGAPLLASIEAALSDLGAACAQVRAQGLRTRPVLSISASGSVSTLWLAPRLAAFAALHPSVIWQARAIEENTPDLVAENLDLAILRAPHGQPLPSGDRLLFAESVFPVCSPSLLQPGDDPLRLVRDKNLLEEGPGGSAEKGWRTWLGVLGHATARPNIVYFSTFNAVIAAAIAGAGIALGRAPLIDADLAAGRLIKLFPDRSMTGSWDFVIRARPGAARDIHVRHFLTYLLDSANSAAVGSAS